MLCSLVEARTQREAASDGNSSSEDKVKLSDRRHRGVPNNVRKDDRWPYKLAPMPTGKAQQAYAAMEPTRIADYVEANLRHHDISEETYRQHFRVTMREGETYPELATRTENLMEKWL